MRLKAATTVIVGTGQGTVVRRGTLTTFALGSCIAVCAWDPAARIAGLLHFMLGDSAVDPNRARTQPGVFADTGVRGLIQMLEAAGADVRRCRFRLVGGASIPGAPDIFQIGKRNAQAAHYHLNTLGVRVEVEATGGAISRGVSLDAGTGQLLVFEGGEKGYELCK